MPDQEATSTSDLWAITSYFNPFGARRRLQNFRKFRRSLGVPLVAVEVSFDGNWELAPCDAEILVRRRGRDVLWQKERLLNIALTALPKRCQKVAWIDCDVVLARKDWAAETSRLLDEYTIAQPFDLAYDLAADEEPGSVDHVAGTPMGPSVASDIVNGRWSIDALTPYHTRATAQPGLAWAARRDVIESCGFYDFRVVGGGDSAMATALIGDFDGVPIFQRMNDQQREHYVQWAKCFHLAADGRISYLPGALYHLWHGDLANRRYGERHLILQRHDFDPSTDVAIDPSGCLCWSSNKPELHREVSEYFRQRREDG